ncbi:hypothetical protein Gorai_014866, partial [Gossypium raimondii]|nr:hypothetical protein [Gossypium raimondii]
MMDIENGYFLIKFQNKLDCEKALSKAYPNVVIAWIRFPGLLGYLYKYKILAEIGEM